MRIVIAAFGLESSTFTSVEPSRESLYIRREQFAHNEVLKIFSERGIEVSQAMAVSGTPTGVLDAALYHSLKSEVIECIVKCAPFDGVLMLMHGSMLYRENGALFHGELEFLKTLRKEVGASMPISVRLDLHGNIPAEFGGYVTVISALRTAPHRDGLQVAQRAARLLIRAIEADAQWHSEVLRVPLLLTGEQVITDDEPAHSLYGLLEQSDLKAGIVSSSIMVGFAWADSPWTGASVIVTAENREAANKECLYLADEFLKRKAELINVKDSLPVEDALAHMKTNHACGMVFSDSGDNVTAGGPGTSTFLLDKMIESNIEGYVFAQFYDPESLRLIVENSPDAVTAIRLCDTLNLSVKLTSVHNIDSVTIVVAIAAGNTIIITDKRVPLATPDIFSKIGLNPFASKGLIVKLGYLMPELKDSAPCSAIILTPGPTALLVSQFTYQKVQHPLYPLDS